MRAFSRRDTEADQLSGTAIAAAERGRAARPAESISRAARPAAFFSEAASSGGTSRYCSAKRAMSRNAGAATTPPKIWPCGSSIETRTTSRGRARRDDPDERGDVVRVRVAAVRIGLRRGAGLAGDEVPGHGRLAAGALRGDDALEHPHQLAGDRSPTRPAGARASRRAGRGRGRRGAAAPRRPCSRARAYIDAIWIGVTAIPWPIGTLPIVEPDQCSTRQHDPGALAREVDPGLLAEAEPRDPGRQALRAEQLARA